METMFQAKNHGHAVAILRASDLSWQPTLLGTYGQRKPSQAPVNPM